ncbi:uncharacterized protein LOC122322411 [Drosophila grimshawi]|uniref:GH11147 n=1 Tax=Drosophila grimshawi TaxID=7222 RepID=B4JDA3_DROGR|nr:uncharacterized protein LOC122322411 [Drosophila grimshawi]EDW03276.1 GH11147 [Drosophila grimshawi]
MRRLQEPNMSLYDAMQVQNCKTFNYRNKEMYPSIRPPVSPCSPDLTAQWLAHALEDNGCERPFDMENDDIVEVWKRSPKKDSLRFYGIGSAIHKPEAIVFNQLISKCLDKVNRPKPKTIKPKTIPPESENYPERTSENYVLNRQKLQSKIDRKPAVREVVDASNALNWFYCPFSQSQPKVSLRNALDMERPGPKPKQRLKRKHKYCEPQCDIPENKCTEFEWSKSQQDTKAYQDAYKIEMARLAKECDTDQLSYDELYSDLITCLKKIQRKIHTRMLISAA